MFDIDMIIRSTFIVAIYFQWSLRPRGSDKIINLCRLLQMSHTNGTEFISVQIKSTNDTHILPQPQGIKP